MMHKLRSVMSLRDGKHKLTDSIELDEGYFSSDNGVDGEASVIADNARGHRKLGDVVNEADARTVPGKDAPKVLRWVHVAIVNAKKLIDGMYHGVKVKSLLLYLDEYCYKFNRKYFGNRLFDRLMICSVSYRPDFEHQLYGSKPKEVYTDRCG